MRTRCIFKHYILPSCFSIKCSDIISQSLSVHTNPVDEVSRTTIGSSIDVQYASEFDEVTINPVTNGLVKRETRDGKLLVGGYFDEWTTALDAP